jgi:hypothetical protein
MITVTPALQNEFRDDLAIVASWARVTARLAPNATDAANLPSTFLGMLPNGSYLHAGRLATYVEPALPWPATTTEDPGDGTTSPRALRAHSSRPCVTTRVTPRSTSRAARRRSTPAPRSSRGTSA